MLLDCPFSIIRKHNHRLGCSEACGQHVGGKGDSFNYSRSYSEDKSFLISAVMDSPLPGSLSYCRGPLQSSEKSWKEFELFPLHVGDILHFSVSLPSSLVSCSWPGQVGTALPCVTGAAAEGTAATGVSRPDGSKVSGCYWDEKVPPQQDVQGQGLIKFKLDILHHLLPWVFCLLLGEKNSTTTGDKQYAVLKARTLLLHCCHCQFYLLQFLIKASSPGRSKPQ